jgi:hypothetical protein
MWQKIRNGQKCCYESDSIRLVVGGTVQGNNNAGGYITTADTNSYHHLL